MVACNKQSLKSKLMIRKNSLFCKMIRIKTSTKFLFDSFMADFLPESEECPFCHSSGNCKIHAYYDRSIIDIVHGKPVYQQICVTRVICESCGHTHAILPDSIIPYAQYSLFFILRVLGEYFSHRKTVVILCDTYGITVSMLYRWRDLFLKNRSVYLSILDQMNQKSLQFLKYLVLLPAYSAFSNSFFRLTGSSFLQSHASPTALYRQT